MKWLKWLEKNIWKYPNVNGFSGDLQFKEVNGKPTKQLSVRIYVEEKVPLGDLFSWQWIPQFIEFRTWRKFWKKQRIVTDIKKLGKVVKFIDKTINFRPVELGVSVGNEKITAGSLGHLYEPTANIQIGISPYVCGSNAHVVTDGNPSKAQEEIIYKNILQRGAHHGGKVPDDVVGEYVWHQQIYPIEIPSDCTISKLVAWFLNGLSSLFGRKTRFKPTVNGINTIDFGIYKPTVDHILKVADDSIDPTKEPFIGHLYAGSDVSGIICAIDEILGQAKDYIKRPLGPWIKREDLKVGDRVKGCSFWCNFETDIIDINATINVNYGTFMAIMTKAIIVTNDGTIKGGWSGSGWHKVG